MRRKNEFAFSEFSTNPDGTKRPNDWTPPLHKIDTDDIELLWLYWERAEIEFREIDYKLKNMLPDTRDEAKEYVAETDDGTDEEKRILTHLYMMQRQQCISDYYEFKEYLQGVRGKIQIAQRGKGAPDLPEFTDYEYDAYYLPKPTTATQPEQTKTEATKNHAKNEQNQTNDIPPVLHWLVTEKAQILNRIFPKLTAYKISKLHHHALKEKESSLKRSIEKVKKGDYVVLGMDYVKAEQELRKYLEIK